MARMEELDARINSLHNIFNIAGDLRKARKNKSRSIEISDLSEKVDERGYHLPLLDNALHEDTQHWTNRLVMHNPEIQVSNASRDILLKYYYSTRARKAEACELYRH